MQPLVKRKLSFANKLARAVWSVVWAVLFRPTPIPFHVWRAWLLRIFGAQIGKRVRIYPSARIWAPWNLSMEDDSCLGQHVDCYTVDRIRIGQRAVVSMRTFLCTASRDYTDPGRPLMTAPITIAEDAWVAAEVFVGPGVEIGAGGIALARAVVTRDIGASTVHGGHPAKYLRSYRSQIAA